MNILAMSFIDKFLDLTSPLPREIIRYLHLLKELEKRYKDNKTTLRKKRESFLHKLKTNNIPSNMESQRILSEIEKNHEDLLSLSNYKKEIIKHIQEILKKSFLEKLNPIIEEGKKECEEEINKNITSPINNIYKNSTISTINNSNNTIIIKTSNLNSNNINMNNISDKTKKNELSDSMDFDSKDSENKIKSFLGNKKKRTKLSVKNIKLKNQSEVYYPEADKNQVYCVCHKSSYGNMIQCENPDCKGKWFHYECVGINANTTLDKAWYCSKECEIEAKKRKDKGKIAKKKKKI